MIPIRRALRLGEAAQIAFVGAGGKSSAIFALARQFDRPVLVTTTTHLSRAQADSAELCVTLDGVSDVQNLDPQSLPAVTVFVGIDKSTDRVTGPDPETLQSLSNFARKNSLALLIEADGARLRALKAPAEHEPAIPSFVDAVVVVAGLSAIGEDLTERLVHRPQRFADHSGARLGDRITAQMVQAVLLSEVGGLKNIPRHVRKIVLLNQADTPELESIAQELSRSLLSSFGAVWIASLKKSSDLISVYEPVAGILLAAGESKRLGQPKALLDWKGKTFVRQVAETSVAAGLKPLVVVTGANAEPVEKELIGLEIQIMRNVAWYEGQSSSVKAGLRKLPRNIGAALFMVVDQPQLPIALVEKLVAEHAHSLAHIVAPLVDDHRTNPVLFDQETFSSFASLEGDIGGRAIFSKYQVIWVPWIDSSLAIDVDTQEDYQRLLESQRISK